MKALVLLMIETEQPEGISARKLVVETAKHNVITAYNAGAGMDLLRRFPKVDAVLVHGLLPGCRDLVAEIVRFYPDLPVIVASPAEGDYYPGASFVVPSHQPAKLLEVLANGFGVSISN